MCYSSVEIVMNSCYNSNLQQLIKKLQAKVDSGIIEIGDLIFPKIDRTFSEIYPEHPHENILKFEKYTVESP